MKRLLIIITLFFSLGFLSELKAQPGPGGGGQPGCFPPPCVPIDGGLSWLLIAGTIYGGKKAYEFSKEERK